MQPGLYAFPGLLEGLSLGHLCWVVGTHAYNVCTGEDENIGDQLQQKGKKKQRERYLITLWKPAISNKAAARTQPIPHLFDPSHG